MSRRNWGSLGGAALVGAAIVFPAGVFLGSRETTGQKAGPEVQRSTAAPQSNFRNFYSPKIHDDPYVQDQWRKVVEELEAQCRHTGERCTEAKAARRSLNEKW